MPLDLHMVGWFTINFALCFIIAKAHGWGDIPKMQGSTWLLPHCRPLSLRMPPTLGLYPTPNHLLKKIMHLIKAFTMLDWISSLYTIRMAMKPHCTQLCFLVCKVYQAHLVTTGNFIVFQLTLTCLITNCSTYWIWFSKYFTHRNHSSIKVWSFATWTRLGLVFSHWNLCN